MQRTSTSCETLKSRGYVSSILVAISAMVTMTSRGWGIPSCHPDDRRAIASQFREFGGRWNAHAWVATSAEYTRSALGARSDRVGYDPLTRAGERL